MFPIHRLILLALLALPGLTAAQSASLFPHGDSAARAPLIPARATALSGHARAASLFVGKGTEGLLPPARPQQPAAPCSGHHRPPIGQRFRRAVAQPDRRG